MAHCSDCFHKSINMRQIAYKHVFHHFPKYAIWKILYYLRLLAGLNRVAKSNPSETFLDIYQKSVTRSQCSGWNIQRPKYLQVLTKALWLVFNLPGHQHRSHAEKGLYSHLSPYIRLLDDTELLPNDTWNSSRM